MNMATPHLTTSFGTSGGIPTKPSPNKKMIKVKAHPLDELVNPHLTCQMESDLNLLDMLNSTIECLRDKQLNIQALNCMEQSLWLKRRMFGVANSTVQKTLQEVVLNYNSMAMQFLAKAQFNQCLSMLRKAEAILTPGNFTKCQSLQILTFNNIGCCYRKLGKLKSALRYLQHAAQIGAGCCHIKNLSITHLNLCAIQSQLGRHDLALEHAQAAIFHAQQELVQDETSNKLQKNSKTRHQGRDQADPDHEEDEDMSTGFEDVLDAKSQEEKLIALAVAYHNLAVELEFNGRSDACLQWYKKALQLVWKYRETNQALCKSFRKTFVAAKKKYEHVTMASTRFVPSAFKQPRPNAVRPKSATTSRRCCSPAKRKAMNSPIKASNAFRTSPGMQPAFLDRECFRRMNASNPAKSAACSAMAGAFASETVIGASSSSVSRPRPKSATVTRSSGITASSSKQQQYDAMLGVAGGYDLHPETSNNRIQGLIGGDRDEDLGIVEDDCEDANGDTFDFLSSTRQPRFGSANAQGRSPRHSQSRPQSARPLQASICSSARRRPMSATTRVNDSRSLRTMAMQGGERHFYQPTFGCRRMNEEQEEHQEAQHATEEDKEGQDQQQQAAVGQRQVHRHQVQQQRSKIAHPRRSSQRHREALEESRRRQQEPERRLRGRDRQRTVDDVSDYSASVSSSASSVGSPSLSEHCDGGSDETPTSLTESHGDQAPITTETTATLGEEEFRSCSSHMQYLRKMKAMIQSLQQEQDQQRIQQLQQQQKQLQSMQLMHNSLAPEQLEHSKSNSKPLRHSQPHLNASTRPGSGRIRDQAPHASKTLHRIETTKQRDAQKYYSQQHEHHLRNHDVISPLQSSDSQRSSPCNQNPVVCSPNSSKLTPRLSFSSAHSCSTTTAPPTLVNISPLVTPRTDLEQQPANGSTSSRVSSNGGGGDVIVESVFVYENESDIHDTEKLLCQVASAKCIQTFWRLQYAKMQRMHLENHANEHKAAILIQRQVRDWRSRLVVQASYDPRIQRQLQRERLCGLQQTEVHFLSAQMIQRFVRRVMARSRHQRRLQRAQAEAQARAAQRADLEARARAKAQAQAHTQVRSGQASGAAANTSEAVAGGDHARCTQSSRAGSQPSVHDGSSTVKAVETKRRASTQKEPEHVGANGERVAVMQEQQSLADHSSTRATSKTPSSLVPPLDLSTVTVTDTVKHEAGKDRCAFQEESGHTNETKRIAAATKLQSFFRMVHVRQLLDRSEAANLSRMFVEHNHWQNELEHAWQFHETLSLADVSATKIQAVVRGHQSRLLTEALKVGYDAAAHRIQSMVRHNQYKATREQRKAVHAIACQVIQRAFRAFVERKQEREAKVVQEIAAQTIQNSWDEYQQRRRGSQSEPLVPQHADLSSTANEGHATTTVKVGPAVPKAPAPTTTPIPTQDLGKQDTVQHKKHSEPKEQPQQPQKNQQSKQKYRFSFLPSGIRTMYEEFLRALPSSHHQEFTIEVAPIQQLQLSFDDFLVEFDTCKDTESACASMDAIKSLVRAQSETLRKPETLVRVALVMKKRLQRAREAADEHEAMAIWNDQVTKSCCWFLHEFQGVQ